MLNVGPDADLMNKMNVIATDDYAEPTDEMKGSDSRASPKYARTPERPQKRVTFHHTAFVVLIPTVQEYRDVNLADALWWNEHDFLGFKISAAKEVKEFMKTVPHLDAKKAMKLYFQQVTQLTREENSPLGTQEAHPHPLQIDIPPIVINASNDEATEKESSSDDEYEECRESEVCRIVSQRHDSVTESKFPRHHPPQTPSHEMASYLRTIESKPLEKSDASTSSADETLGVSMDSLSVLARVMALGVFVFMNRSNTTH